jgi:hypothetical protein
MKSARNGILFSDLYGNYEIFLVISQPEKPPLDRSFPPKRGCKSKFK